MEREIVAKKKREKKWQINAANIWIFFKSDIISTVFISSIDVWLDTRYRCNHSKKYIYIYTYTYRKEKKRKKETLFYSHLL